MKRVGLAAVSLFLLFAIAVFSQTPPQENKSVPQSAVQPAQTIQPVQTIQPARTQQPAKEEPKSASTTPEITQAPKSVVKPPEISPVPTPEVKVPEKSPVPAKGNINASPQLKAADQVYLNLFEITEGDFRYKRIQGFVPEKKNQTEAKNSDSKVKMDDKPDPERSKRRASILVWITFISAIVLILALYRYNRKKRRRKVFRRIQ